MNKNELVLLADAVGKIHKITHTSVSYIVEALTGIAWNEQYAGLIKRYHICPEIFTDHGTVVNHRY